MSYRTSLPALLVVITLFSAACVLPTGDDEVATEGSAGSSDEQTSDDETGAGTDDATDTAEDADNEEPVDNADAEMPEGEDAEAVSSLISGDIPADVEACVIVGAIGDPPLLAALITAGDDAELSDLEFEDQLALFELAVECGGPDLTGQFISDGFADGSGVDAPPEMVDCFVEKINRDEGALIMAGMIALGDDVAPPEQTKGPLVDTLTNCVPASFLASTAVSELADDPTFVEATDTDCIDAAYADNSLTRPLWVALVDDPGSDFADLPPEVTAEVFSPLFGCISFGQVVAAEAAADGVVLSDGTISCIDDEFVELGFFDSILLGEEPDDAAIGAIVISCFTPEELLQLGSA